jgi:hypothetical protein
MTKAVQTIYNEIISHMNKEGSSKRIWYCGITSNIDSRLRGDHNVPKVHWHIYRFCQSSDDARAIEKGLLELGCDGGQGGGDANSKYVYAYKKTGITKP